MTISGYSNVIVDVMLGWLKGFANWVLRLFNLAGSGGGSPLLWLSRNWLKLLIFFLVVGVVVDRLVWLIRWRPYWVWFRKERVIVNDDKFFAGEDHVGEDVWEDDVLDGNWQERDYVVASTVVRRRPEKRRPGDRAPAGRGVSRAGGKPAGAAGNAAQERQERTDGRPKADSAPAGTTARRRRPVRRLHPGEAADRRKRPRRLEVPVPRAEDLFGVDTNQADASDFFEDEVFNVSNLPVPDEFEADRER